jgi:hypothetical protein
MVTPPGVTPPVSGVAKIRQQMEAMAQAPRPEEFQKPSAPPKFDVDVSSSSSPRTAYSPEESKQVRTGGGIIPIVAGPGTNMENAVNDLVDAWDADLLPVEGLSEEQFDALDILIETLRKALPEMAVKPPSASEQLKIFALVSTLRSGSASAIKAQIVSLGIAPAEEEAVEEEKKPESKEEEADPPAGAGDGGYMDAQFERLAELDEEVMDAISVMGAGKYAGSLASGVTKQKAKNAGKVVLKTGIAAGLSQVPGGGAVFSLAMAVNQVRSTVKHMKNLRKIELAINQGSSPDKAKFMEDVGYILSKKKRKAVKSGLGGVPVVGTAKTVFGLGKAAYKMVKGTRGVHRREAAARIIERAQRNDIHAKMIILELVGEANYKTTLHAPNGVDLLMVKLMS